MAITQPHRPSHGSLLRFITKPLVSFSPWIWSMLLVIMWMKDSCSFDQLASFCSVPTILPLIIMPLFSGVMDRLVLAFLFLSRSLSVANAFGLLIDRARGLGRGRLPGRG